MGRVPFRLPAVIPALALLGTLAGPLDAQSPATDTASERRPYALDSLVVEGRRGHLVGAAASPNQGAVGAADIALRPLLRPGEVVENIPGVIVTQHSGSGKANQYFLRGFNLDHGTDLAIGVDGVPVNLPSHAHGQGYADLNFLVPELVEGVEFEKGTYYAGVGDLGSAGSFDVGLFDRLPAGLFCLDGGQFGYERAVAGGNFAGVGGSGFAAGEFEHNDGPWAVGERTKKLDGVLRYTRGDRRSMLRLTLMGYHNDWHATDQVPDRAIADGQIGRFGTVDSTDAGNTGRYSLSVDWRSLTGRTSTRLLAYACAMISTCSRTSLTSSRTRSTATRWSSRIAAGSWVGRRAGAGQGRRSAAPCKRRPAWSCGATSSATGSTTRRRASASTPGW